MKKRFFSLLLVLLTLLSSIPALSQAQSPQTVTILFIHDMHSHLSSRPYADSTRGGFARLQTLIERERALDSDLLLLDAGDFSMGTLYQTVFQTDAAELMMMARLGFDATTLGNHEFDYRGQGLADMLHAALAGAQEKGLTLPSMLSANVDWSSVSTPDGESFQKAMEAFGAMEHMLIDAGGVKVGIFGVMGADSVSVAPLAPVAFTSIIESAKAQVQLLKSQGADLIVCLSHSGLWEEADRSEDELLAKAVPEIDLIISGHTHTTLHQPLIHGSTHIVSCGEYTNYLGKIVLEQAADRWQCSEYALLPTGQDVPENADIQAEVLSYLDQVDENYLSRFGFTRSQILCQNPGNLLSEESLLSDAIIHAVKKAEGETFVPVDLAVVPAGIIRTTLPEGGVTVSDAYNVLSLGIGPDGVPGYPLVSVYLTGRELLDLAEVDVSVSSLMDGTHLFPAGGGWEYASNRLILSRVIDMWLYDAEGEKIPLEKDRLYRVVADLYSSQLLGTVKDKSFGLLRLEPKAADGSLIEDFEKHIVYNQEGEEVKIWAALADYLAYIGGEDGQAVIGDEYQKASDRIVETRASTLSQHLSNAGRIWYVLAAAALALLLLIALLVLAIRLMIRRIRRRRRKA